MNPLKKTLIILGFEIIVILILGLFMDLYAQIFIIGFALLIGTLWMTAVVDFLSMGRLAK